MRATDAAGNQDPSPASRSWIVAVTDPDPDPGANCMEDPSVCGYPDVENTGVLPGVARQTVNGDVTLSTAGQVYENKTVFGTINVYLFSAWQKRKIAEPVVPVEGEESGEPLASGPLSRLRRRRAGVSAYGRPVTTSE